MPWSIATRSAAPGSPTGAPSIRAAHRSSPRTSNTPWPRRCRPHRGRRQLDRTQRRCLDRAHHTPPDQSQRGWDYLRHLGSIRAAAHAAWQTTSSSASPPERPSPQPRSNCGGTMKRALGSRRSSARSVRRFHPRLPGPRHPRRARPGSVDPNTPDDGGTDISQRERTACPNLAGLSLEPHHPRRASHDQSYPKTD